VGFGILTLQQAPWPDLVKRWRFDESLGFDHQWVADHMNNPGAPQDPWYDGWTALAGLAHETTTIRIGTLVTNMTLRTPGVLAKAAITLDHASGGRLNLGLGAGGDFKTDNLMTGVESWPPAERVARFREFVHIVDLLLRNEEASYEGSYYSAPKAVTRPRPVQQPRPPIAIGARGPKMIEIAAQYADVFNHLGSFGQPEEELLEAFPKRNALLDEACERVGRDPKSIVRSMLVATRPNPWESVDAFTGIVERFRAVGIEDFVFYYPWLPDWEGEALPVMERIAQDVLPELRT
jgi:alkanesulfonate monooxygenase SsuD/methylene tetrahydromethanopterin reductase-like flavin-dependent oxidoreductase (luciferase family)